MATTINHGQIAQVNSNGDVDIFYPKTFSSDVYVNSNKKTLDSFIGSTDISSIGGGTVTGAISNISGRVTTNANNIVGKSPTNHASTGTGYGMGNASNFGHVKISDNYWGSDGAAANGVAASSQAVANQWYRMGSFSAGGGGHGTDHTMYCKHNVSGDNRFYIGMSGGHETRVDYASASYTASNTGNTSSITSAIKFSNMVKSADGAGNVELAIDNRYYVVLRVVNGDYNFPDFYCVPFCMPHTYSWFVNIRKDVNPWSIISGNVRLFVWYVSKNR